MLKLTRFRQLKDNFRETSIGRSIVAVSDQGIISLGNFLTGILLARHLPQSEFGTYALIIGILLSANSVHAALIGQPLFISSAQAIGKSVGQLATSSLFLTVGLSVFLNLGVFVALSVLHRTDLAIGVFGVSLLWQFQEVLRRSLVSQLRQAEALWGDGLSYLGQAGLVWFFMQQKWLSLNIVFIIMMLTSGLAALLQALQLRLQSVSFKMVIDFAKSFWNFGRWILLTNIMTILVIQLFPWSLRLFHGPEATASFQVVWNVLGVSNPIIFSLGGLIIPAVTQASIEGDHHDVWKAAWKYALPLGSLLLIYYVVLIIWPEAILSVLYGPSSPYLSLGLETPLRVLVLAFALMYCSIVCQSLLYGLKDTRAVFIVQLVSTSIGLMLGISLVISGEVLGACTAILLIQIISLVMLVWFLKKRKVA